MAARQASPTLLLILLGTVAGLSFLALLMLGPLLVNLAQEFQISVVIVGQLVPSTAITWGSRLHERARSLIPTSDGGCSYRIQLSCPDHDTAVWAGAQMVPAYLSARIACHAHPSGCRRPRLDRARVQWR